MKLTNEQFDALTKVLVMATIDLQNTALGTDEYTDKLQALQTTAKLLLPDQPSNTIVDDDDGTEWNIDDMLA